MKKNGRFKSVALCLLVAFVLVIQPTTYVFAEQLENNEVVKDQVAEGDSMERNLGEIGSNDGLVKTNNGYIGKNNGTIETNNAVVGSNDGTINTNNGAVRGNDGSVKTNGSEGYISSNTGTVNDNKGYVSDNKGTITNNAGEVTYNEGVVSSNTGKVDDNQGTVKVNKGYVNNNGTPYYEHPLEPLVKTGVVEVNYGTVLNSGIVKLNKGRVFDRGGRVISNQGKLYYELAFELPPGVSDKAWSYKLHSGFISFNGSDRWLEKNAVGELTFKLNKGYGWVYDYDFATPPRGCIWRINDDGTMTIIVDGKEWEHGVVLEIPLTQLISSDSIKSNGVNAVVYKKSEVCTFSFDLDGGAFNKGTDKEETGVVDRYAVKGSQFLFSEIPEKDGYDFVCWEEVDPQDDQAKQEEQDEPTRYKAGDSCIAETDITFKAIWEKKED